MGERLGKTIDLEGYELELLEQLLQDHINRGPVDDEYEIADLNRLMDKLYDE